MEIHKAKKFAEFGEGSGKREITNGLNFRVAGLDTVCTNFMPKELERRNTENAFRLVDDDTILSETVEK